MSVRRREEDAYAAQVGEDALARQKAVVRCPYCWQIDPQPHSALCPHRDEDEDAAPAEQDEALF